MEGFKQSLLCFAKITLTSLWKIDLAQRGKQEGFVVIEVVQGHQMRSQTTWVCEDRVTLSTELLDAVDVGN